MPPPIVHRHRGAKRAREAREALRLDRSAPLACLLDCVEERAVLPVVVMPMAEGLEGACFGGRLLFVNGRQPAVRQRFTLAHELGHVRCGHDGTVVVDEVETIYGPSKDWREREANAFAAEFLVPAVAVEELAPEGRDPTLDEIVTIAAYYGTSAAMTLFRFSTCELISSEALAALKARIDEQEHLGVYERLGLDPIADRLGTLDALPYLSPPIADGQLGAALRGEAAASPALALAIERLLGR